MRTWSVVAAAAAIGLVSMGAATTAHADGWTDSLNSRPFATAKPTRAAAASPVDRPQRRTASLPSVPTGSSYTGVASYYWQPQPVASGGRFNPNAMTAAHKTLPFGTKVRVTHLGNGQSVDVVINDRGPYIQGRIIDLSKAAAGKINMQGQGIAQVRVDVIGR
ncbi:MAG: septal ring lytic transglycosylase RlpA family protein [Hyphomicrobiaceae bacterium]